MWNIIYILERACIRSYKFL